MGETSAVKRALRDACAANDPQAAAKALLRWAEAVWPEAPPRSLGALAIRITPAALEPLKALEERLYARGDQPWEGAALAEALSDGLGTGPAKSQGGPGRPAAPLSRAGLSPRGNTNPVGRTSVRPERHEGPSAPQFG